MKKLSCLLTLIVCAFSVHAGEEERSEFRPLATKRAKSGAHYAILPNGCEIIVMEKHSAPVVAVQGWMRTGGIDENRWLGAGLSHFCEHMLFKGTTKRPPGKIDQEIRGSGGDDNAYTSSERTVYHVTTQASGFDTAFSVIADMLMDSTFPADETQHEHGVVYKEIERFLDNPDGVLWETFEQTVFQVHPYRVPVLGYPDRFKRVTRDEVFAYYQQRYSPQMCCFVVVGDVDAKTVIPKMCQTLGVWKRKSVETTTIPVEPEQVAPRFVQIAHPLCEVPKMMLGFPSVSLRDPDCYALDLLSSILGDGRASRLYREVKDAQGLALEITAFNYTPMYPGYFTIMATLEPDKLDGARAAIAKVIEAARLMAPTEEELVRAKRKVQTQHVMKQMTAEGMAEQLGSDWFVAGDLDFSDHYNERMQKVTAEDVLRVAKKYLSPEKLNTAILLPPAVAAQQKDVTKGADNKDTKAALKTELNTLKAHPNVADASLLEDKAVFEVKLKPSGVRVVVREDSSLPLVNVAAAALGGTRWEPAGIAGAANMLAEMLDRGTQKRDKLAIAKEAENLGASISTFSGRNSFGVSSAGLKNDLPKLLDIVSDCMLHPKFAADELGKLRGDVLQQIAQEDESLGTLNSKILRPLLYGSHPYARQNLGTAETVKKVTAEDLKRLHETWIQPENIALSFVGDISATDAVNLSLQFFGHLAPGKFVEPKVPPVEQLTESKSGEGSKAGIQGAILTLAFPGVALKSPDREVLDLMASLLSGLGGRLNTELREKQGLAYSVGVQNDTQLDGGALIFFIQTDAKSVDKALVGMWGEAKKLRDEAVPQDELENVKNYLAGTEAIELQNQGSLAQRLAMAQLYGEGAAHVFSRKARLEKVNSEQMKAAAQKYLDLNRWVKTVFKPK